MEALERKVKRRIISEIEGIFINGQKAIFPYDDLSTLEEIGMDELDAAEFLIKLEDAFGVDFNEFLEPLYNKATEKARLISELDGEKSIYAPEIAYQENQIKLRDLREYIVLSIKAKEIEKEMAVSPEQ